MDCSSSTLQRVVRKLLDNQRASAHRKRSITDPDVEGGDGFAVSGVNSGSLFSGQSSPAVTSCCASSASLDPAGARWRVDTEDSRPSGKRTKAHLLSRRHAGIDLPEVDRREKTKNRSWGVAFVKVHSNERTACRASGRTAGHCSVGSPCDFKASNGTPNKENSSTRHFLAEAADTSAQGNANGNLEYSSTTINIYLWFWCPGSGPLKSMLRRSKG
ncbi:hypothetical protein T06_14744 [Trichinella sp. T6]|nr:hypothetical protein T06_14744 [Trichinella sp. T6]